MLLVALESPQQIPTAICFPFLKFLNNIQVKYFMTTGRMGKDNQVPFPHLHLKYSTLLQGHLNVWCQYLFAILNP